MRDIAATPCTLCKEPLGFGRAIYCYPTRAGHAEAMDEAYEECVERMVRDLAALAADLYIKENYPHLAHSLDSTHSWRDRELEQPRKRKRRRKLSKQYVLPEHDFHSNIPVGRGSRSDDVVQLDQQHHLLWPGDPDELPWLARLSRAPGAVTAGARSYALCYIKPGVFG